MTAPATTPADAGPGLDADTLDQLRGTLDRLLAGPGPLDVLGALSDLGWEEIAPLDPAATTSALFTALGTSLAPAAALDLVVLSSLGGPSSDLEPLTLDPLTTAVVYPALDGGSDPSATARDGTLRVRGVVLTGFERATTVAVPLVHDGRATVALTEVGPWLAATPVGGLDPSAGWSTVDGSTSVAEARILEGEAWAPAGAAAHRAQGSELVAMSRAMLALAVEHVGSREQFGRPIGTFQAVKHHVADVLVAIEAADSAVAGSWHRPDRLTSAAARAAAGRAHAEAARHGQQVLGAMGFTWEHPFHTFVRRGFMVDALLGSWRTHDEAVGRALLAAGTILRPPVW